jgi:hypothetical protein
MYFFHPLEAKKKYSLRIIELFPGEKDIWGGDMTNLKYIEF